MLDESQVKRAQEGGCLIYSSAFRLPRAAISLGESSVKGLQSI